MIKRTETFPDKFYGAVRKHCGSVLAAKLSFYEQQGLVFQILIGILQTVSYFYLIIYVN